MNYPRIRELRLLHNLKQEYVAEQLKISQPEYSRLENGLREPRMEDFHSLSRLYGVKPAAFIPENDTAELSPDSTEGKLKRSTFLISQTHHWSELFEQNQQLMGHIVESQRRSEQLFDRLIQLLAQRQAG